MTFEEFLGEESKIEKLFKKMDTNNDGKVSEQVRCEILKVLSNLIFSGVSLRMYKPHTESGEKVVYGVCKPTKCGKL